MVEIALRCVSVRTEQIVITSLVSVRVVPVSWDITVNRVSVDVMLCNTVCRLLNVLFYTQNVLLVRMDTAVDRCVIV